MRKLPHIRSSVVRRGLIVAATATVLVPLTSAVAPASASGCASTVLRQSSHYSSCVVTLQRRLAQLHYDVGRADGYFGTTVFHAVVAFQKVNGLGRTGVVDSRTWSRLSSGTVLAKLRYIRSGSGLEISLGKQVMLRASGGALVAIYDVSTGRPSLPTPVSGSRPFTIWRKTLWGSTGYNDREHYVQYYYRGSLLAIHGYSYVPAYPASHGCIRMPPGSAARLWANTFVGERVYTYY
jgi:N-acetylmuramoyl-L-alanine amidase